MKWQDAEEVLPPHWTRVMLRFDNGEENPGMRNQPAKGWISFVKGEGSKVTHWSYIEEPLNNA